jgi:hypothetical protein
VAPRVHIVRVDVCYQSLGNTIHAYQVQCMCVHVMTPGRLSWLNRARAKSKFLMLPNWDQPAKEDNPDRKH